MAAAIFLVTVDHPEKPVRALTDGVSAVLINHDDGDTDAQIIAAAATQCRAAGHHDIPDVGYFATVQQVDDLVAGPLKDAEDAMIFGGRYHGSVGV